MYSRLGMTLLCCFSLSSMEPSFGGTFPSGSSTMPIDAGHGKPRQVGESKMIRARLRVIDSGGSSDKKPTGKVIRSRNIQAKVVNP